MVLGPMEMRTASPYRAAADDSSPIRSVTSCLNRLGAAVRGGPGGTARVPPVGTGVTAAARVPVTLMP
ncbi:hypothetical protein Pta02_41640 [Planobispora takensis]|uniref:Uncharacterized protein n=1 Tax=Planobispora takensis TaxID=1367882 RepID=A0A8J3WU16_9ACTN|nr:hypothetical protein Pta02_41640 [Planobispora takensis]